MELIKTKIAYKDQVQYTLTIDGGELMNVKFTEFDKALLNDIETSSDVTIADQLLGLEMICRRIEENKK